MDVNDLPWKAKYKPSITHNEERLVEAFSTHWIKYFIPTICFIFFGVTSLYIMLTITPSSPSVTLSLLAATFIYLAVHHWYFHKILSEGMVDVLLTNKRIIYLEDTLWIHDDMCDIHLNHIRAVEAHKTGIIQNVLRYGSLWFDTGGSARSEGRTIPLVPKPHSRAKTIMRLLNLK